MVFLTELGVSNLVFYENFTLVPHTTTDIINLFFKKVVSLNHLGWTVQIKEYYLVMITHHYLH